jgi:hypothetical protein
MRFLLLLHFAVFTLTSLHAQTAGKTTNHQWYVTWGYTRAAYSKSTIHFQNLSGAHNDVTGRTDNYDFTIHNAVAHDRPDFDKIPDVINITVPQYVFRIGRSINDHWGIEFNYDHTKYIVDDWQKVKMTGRMNDNWFSGDTVLNPTTLLHFEHSDGANFWMLNAVRKQKLVQDKNVTVSWVLKPGAGVVIPRTDVTLFGQRLNNRFHVAGWIVGVETGLRLECFRRGFFELTAKGSYADYMNAFVLGKGHGKATHQIYTSQVTLTFGLRFDQLTTKPN